MIEGIIYAGIYKIKRTFKEIENSYHLNYFQKQDY